MQRDAGKKRAGNSLYVRPFLQNSTIKEMKKKNCQFRLKKNVFLFLHFSYMGFWVNLQSIFCYALSISYLRPGTFKWPDNCTALHLGDHHKL